jgi:predicted secreted Zn-dependent protease
MNTHVQRRRARQAALTSLLILGSLFIYPLLSNAYTQTSINISNGVSNAGQNTPVTSSAGSKASPAKSNAASTPVAPTCAKDTGNPDPGALKVNANQPGIQQVVDAPQYYQVYGYTSAQVQGQINRCTPVNEGDDDFAASTNYVMNWAYSYSDDSNSCTITSVAVGVHVAQIYPYWNNSSYAAPGYASRWQSYMANLQTHENGHRDLDIQYAAKISHDLQGLPSTDCSAIEQAATATANADVTALNQANDAYDAQTNHGMTQGAIIPS